MKTLVIVCLAASLGMAESWTGKLVDAACIDRQAAPQKMQNACAPGRSTTNFAVRTQEGRVLKLDATGNAKAAEMMRISESSKVNDGILVILSGTQEGRVVRVESIELQDQK
jgi:hypothetical protein